MRKTLGLIYGLSAGLGILALSGCSGGLIFNGSENSGAINPRTLPIVHFPLPLESFNEAENVYEVDGTVVFQGRSTASPNASQPLFSEPSTTPLPVAPTSFVFKSSTDVWEMTGEQDRNGNLIPDLGEIGGIGGAALMAGGMSMVCQWMLQAVNGQPRTDTPITYDNGEFQSMEVTIIGHNVGAGANNAPPATAAARHSPVSARIGLFGAASPTEDVITSNVSALNSSVGMPGTNSHVEFALGGGLPGILLGKFQEAPQENLFIEDLTLTLTPDAPVPSYFDADGRAPVPGGIFINAMPIDLRPSYDANLNVAWYYWGVVLGHIMGNGLGIPQVQFTIPGLNNGEEDIMNANIESDISFYTTAGRRFQYTPEGLLHMQNTQRFNLGSQGRADALAKSQADPFDPAGLAMSETTPGPLR